MSSAPAVVETHSAVLFFVGDRVYKVKKRVNLGFVDFRPVESRARACADEVALNRRLAPDVYLGVASVTDESDSPCDSMVVMRRMPEERRLSTLISATTRSPGDSEAVRDAVRAVARTVATFHAHCEGSAELAQFGDPSAVRQLWNDNFDQLQAWSESILERAALDRIRLLADRYLHGRQALFHSRQTSGYIRDGHGDLLADDIFCLDDGPRILDCLEFDRRYRIGDVLADVAFLAMDLEHLKRGDLARDLVDEYARFSGEHHPMSLQHFYIAYRALVRSKVSCMRAEQLTGGGERAAAAAAAAQDLARLADRHLSTGRMRLLLVGGLPGTGKSAVCAGLVDLDPTWTLLRSDQIRKEVAGLTGPAPAAVGEGLYTQDKRRRTYDELLARARRCLEHGESVVLDASWSQQEYRDAAQFVANATGAELLGVQCTAPRAVALDRIARRRGDASDANAAVALAMSRGADPWPDATPLATDAPLGDVVARAAAMLEPDER